MTSILESSVNDEEGKDSNIRLKRLNDALVKFLDLYIDGKKTNEHFKTALPHLDPDVLSHATKEFIENLKNQIKYEKGRLIVTYDLEKKLAQLEELTKEAGTRSKGKEKLIDVWRPNLDLSTAFYSQSIPVQKQRISSLEQELLQVERENSDLYDTLMSTTAREDEMRSEAEATLDCLDETIKGLETSPELARNIKESIDELLKALGPRGTSSGAPDPS